MHATDWLAIALGASLIVWINWYFFVAPHAAMAGSAMNTARGAVPEIVITVDGGYEPAAVRVRAGVPVRLVFDRRDSGSCSEEVVFPDFGIRKFLPTGARTTIEVTPPRAGRYGFTCGMSMLRGTVVAE